MRGDHVEIAENYIDIQDGAEMTFDTDNQDVGDVIGGPPAQLQEGRLDWSHMEEAEEIKLDNEYSDYIGEA